jgi:hypothetical protein
MSDDALQNLKNILDRMDPLPPGGMLGIVEGLMKEPLVESDGPHMGATEVLESIKNQPGAIKSVEKGLTEEKKEKHAGGRPLKYKTEEELQAAIKAYFKECFDPEPVMRRFVRTEDKKKIIVEEPVIERTLPTMTGLGNRIGLSRLQLIQYGKKDEFYNAIREARDIVQEMWEKELLRSGQVTGILFNLKNNHGWKDESHVMADVTNVNDVLDRLEKKANERRVIDVEPK